jgi:hypothetical protein
MIVLPALGVEVVSLLILNHVSSAPWREILEVVSTAAIGSVGAFLSVASRTETITFEPVAGRSIHRFEGKVRVVVGMAGALVVALAIKADLLLGSLHSLTHPFLALLVAGVVAGMSERFAPGVISRMGKWMPDQR